MLTSQDILQDPFILEFTGLPQKKRYKEGELKNALKTNMENSLFAARYQLYFPKREELQAQLDKILEEYPE